MDDGPGDPKELGDEIREGRRSSWRVRRQEERTKEVVRARLAGARLADRWSSWRVRRQDEGTKEVVRARLAVVMCGLGPKALSPPKPTLKSQA